MKEKTKKNIKDTIKDIVALVFIAALIFGGYKLFQNYKSNQINGEDSYKAETKRDTKYNGYYSLTKLDENGNNTWDGLMLHVEKDKIVDCMKYDYTSVEDIKAGIEKLMGDKKYTLKDDVDLIWQAEVDLNLDTDSFLPRGTSITLDSGFLGVPGDKGAAFAPLGAFICKDKVDFNRVTDIKTDYDYMESCDIIPGYDEKNQEVWLSKLLSNKNSTYHKGYKLIKYDSLEDINSNYGK